MPVQTLPLHRMLGRRIVPAKLVRGIRGVGGANNISKMRGFASVSSKDSGATATNPGGDRFYVSPFREIFDTIKEGKTFMGTSQFVAPEIKYLKCGVPEHLLRYKTTTFGRLLEEPFVKPNEHKVTLQVETQYIPLTDMERIVMKEIVGNRLNDETGLLQLSSSQFGSRIENKRHTVSMLERIVESAKALAAKVEADSKATEEVSV